MRSTVLTAAALAGLLLLWTALPVMGGHLSLAVNDTRGNHSPGARLEGSLKLVFDEFLPNTSRLCFYFDGSASPNGSLELEEYVGNESGYETGVYDFSYTLAADGNMRWKEFPDQSFSYGATAYGTCGNEECQGPECCPCWPEPYPCGWVLSFHDMGTGTVSAVQGLVEVYNASLSISLPAGANNDTRWRENSNKNPEVKVAMMERCDTANNGWLTRDLTNFEQIPATTSSRTFIEHFNHTSLSADRRVFQEDCSHPTCGGLYEEVGGVQTYLDFASSCTGAPAGTAYWNGSTGEIVVCYFKGNANYLIRYLPHNGPMICAYTSNYTVNSSSWSGSVTEGGQTSNQNPYSVTYTAMQLPYSHNSTTYYTARVRPALCPGYGPSDVGKGCNITVSSYSVADRQPGDPVEISFDEPRRTVNATAEKTKLAGNYSITIGFATMEGLDAPAAIRQHTVLFSLKDGEVALAETEHAFFTCSDPDGDGYCIENGDCNNNDPGVNPGKEEICNGKDDDCDGEEDEGFDDLGKACGSAYCEGKIICAPDGNRTVCSSELSKGVEICGNDVDDDCDGEKDEPWEQLENGSIVLGCFCMPGTSDVCGSNIGECRQGEKLCREDYTWGDCIGQGLPSEEACNGKDDNCDGITDNIGAKTGEKSSVQETKCGCYGGEDPVDEDRMGCNGIDDNCDGEIDEGLVCCADGQERDCGTSEGVCEYGREECVDGQWSGKCEGGVQPGYEICYDGLDNDCDGVADESESCNPEVTCRNRRQDLNEAGVDCGGPCPNPCGIPLPLILAAAGIVVVIVAVMLMAFEGRL